MSNTESPALLLPDCNPAGARASAYASVMAGIPGTFTEAQVRMVLPLRTVPRADAEARMLAWSEAFTEAQQLCVISMLDLKSSDFWATMADAMEPCALRGVLMRWALLEGGPFAEGPGADR